MDTSKMIATIKQLKSKNQIKRYIDFIKFPFYRNLELNSVIDFDFPLTIFIGQNGCGKSSCLHAIYGAPENHTPYYFWFDTKVDPIQYYDDTKKRHSFWYKYVDENNEVKEVIKARIRRNNDPNYWETSRPLKWAGMKTRERNDRDAPIKKNVVYLDFRSELSAFDKFFYFSNISHLEYRNKQEYIRQKSKNLNRLFQEEEAIIYTKDKLALNHTLVKHSKDIIQYIAYILDKNYIEIKSILHKLFFVEGYSVLFKTNYGSQYSEAFAGSGEMAIFRLVTEVISAPEYSLILLDEPEVSLHPGAQKRLRDFLLDQIIKKKHQIILTTHSPIIASGMPEESIKVFFKNPRNERFLIKQNITPEEAFYYIEFPISNRKNIIVEDILAKSILEIILKDLGEETNNLFNIKYNPGGAQVIIKDFIPVFCRDKNPKDFIVFDGDQKPMLSKFDWKELPNKDLSISNITQKIKEQTNVEIKFSVDGGSRGGNNDQQLELLKKYADYYLNYVHYLPGDIPESIIWNEDFANTLIKNIFNDADKSNEAIAQLQSIINLKDKFAFVTKNILGDDTGENILSIQKQFLQRWINVKNEDYRQIVSIISLIKSA